MPMLAVGVYAASDYKTLNREKVSVYQLGYLVDAALVSLDFIKSPVDNVVAKFKNKIEYYHYYSDNLFFFLGGIANRLTTGHSMPNSKDLCKEKEDYLDDNKKNFFIKDDEFPLLKKKIPRNIIEHLDERNLKTIMECGGVGGFNVLFQDGDPELKASIMQNRNFYPFALDLETDCFLFYNVQSRNDEEKEFSVNLADLETELEELRKRIKDLKNFVLNR